MEKAPDRSEPMITRVVVSYRLPGDATEHEFTIEHTGEGAAVDAVSWSGPLMRKLVYREGGEVREPERTSGRNDWKVTSATSSASGYPECVWIHFNACQWQEWCKDM